ncbi:MAG: toll/interleukin-1 receptor domain-containing protein [Phenylobacterium sp.]|uniref:toll/interleukin-1 receptor domain-containing protein n=1 Tax=Phenylobacterium sp. TaxID=1871053 RepID=UPI0027375E30|nr:toll/interleukin-1 receptor domain-containing protein [Phenylobacterium sp.]MDP3749715.1 toll/interleukin-1 receptor domain-containing protein [Phenylobacterium sp.]
MPRKLFISYSHHDADLLGELRVHLRPYERNGVVEPWFDGFLIPGDDFDREVRKALAACDFIGLLVTPRFLASDYCVDVEMEDAIHRHLEGKARVVPIIAKPCAWKTTSLPKLLATPTDGLPITKWSDADEAWDIVGRDLAKAAGADVARPPAVPASSASRAKIVREHAPPPSQTGFSIPRSSKPTDQEIDDFRHDAFERIAQIFELTLSQKGNGVTGRFRRLDANRFTVTLYRNGSKAASCTIFTGGDFFGSRGIAYNGKDDGATNTMSEELAVEVSEQGVGLVPHMGRAFGRSEDKPMTPDDGAALFWKLLTERL